MNRRWTSCAPSSGRQTGGGDLPCALILINAGVVEGRTLTSVPSVAQDLRNAGATWEDQEAVVDNGLVTSRTPKDLDAFCKRLMEELAEGRHQKQHA